MADWSLFGGVPKVAGINASLSGTDGTTITAHASANTKGSYAEFVASTSVEYNGLIALYSPPVTVVDSLVDVAIGAGGSEQIVAADLYGGSGQALGHVNVFHLPVRIPVGSRLAGRMQATTGGVTGTLLVLGVPSGGFTVGGPAGGVDTYGAAAADSGGVSIDPGASANTKGSWVEVAASTTNALHGLILAFGNQVNTIRVGSRWLVDVAVGAAGSEQVIVENFRIGAAAAGDTVLPQTSPVLPITIPAGTRLSVRAQCSLTDATDRLFDVIIYGIR